MAKYCKVELEDEMKVYYHPDTGTLYVGHEVQEDEIIKRIQNKDRIKKEERQSKDHDAYTLNFMAARTCNMGCKYCFAGEGEYSDNPAKPKVMKSDVYKQAFDWVMDVKQKDIEVISFFGGEPLIGFHEFKNAISYLKNKCHDMKRRFPRIAISTNGVLINDEVMEFIIDYKVKIGLSADGPKYLNNYGRIPKRGTQHKKSSYEYTYDLAMQLRKNHILYAIQCTLNGEHIRQYRPGIIKQWIHDMGDLAKAEMVFVPVSTESEDLKVQDYDVLRNIAVELVDFYFDELMKETSEYTSSLITGPLLGIIYKKYFQSCSGGDGFYLIDTDGGIYPCHVFCNDESYQMGNIYESGNLSRQIEENFLTSNRSRCKDCEECIARNICKVWCNGMQSQYCKDENKVLEERCVFQKEIVEHGIQRLIGLKIKDEQQFNAFVNRMVHQNWKYYSEKNS